MPQSINPHSILVLWCSPNSPNLGLSSIASGLDSLLQNSLEPPISVDFLTHDFSSNRSLPRLSLRNSFVLIFKKRYLQKELARYSLIIDLSEGDGLTRKYGHKNLAKFLISKFLFTRKGPKTIFGPASIENLSHMPNKVLKKGLSRFDYVFVRDTSSSNLLKNLGIDYQKIHDLAFSQNLPALKVSKNFRVALNVSGLLWHKNNYVDFIYYRELIFKIMGVLEKNEVSFDLFPSVIGNSESSDSNVIKEIVSNKQGTTYKEPQNLEKYRNQLQNYDLAIGSRLHFCINALNLGLPTIALQYSDKFEAIDDLNLTKRLDLRDAEFRSIEEYIESEIESLILETSPKKLNPKECEVLFKPLAAAIQESLDLFISRSSTL